MNNLKVLIRDDFDYLVQSKFMLLIWIFVPLFFAISYFFIETAKFIFMIEILSLLALSSAILIITKLINGKNQNMFELYKYRGIEDRTILKSKFIVYFSMIFISFLISIGGVVSVDYLFFQSNISVNFLIKILNFIIFSCGIFVFSNFIGIVLGTLLKSITSGIILAIIIIHNLTLLLWLFLNKVFSQIHISFSQLKVLPFLLGFLVIIFSFCFVLYLNISKSSKL